ncbi:hypothetical protein [Paraburkholderia sp. DGU8]|uniref:hypothetical protein n=1 Tax=Paraburkholderia sp. DGU8 TaxID=3161997 RepID=UPI0034670A7F
MDCPRPAHRYHFINDALGCAVAPHQGLDCGSEWTAIVPVNAQRLNRFSAYRRRDMDNCDVSGRQGKNLSTGKSADGLSVDLDDEVSVAVCPMHSTTLCRAFLKRGLRFPSTGRQSAWS